MSHNQTVLASVVRFDCRGVTVGIATHTHTHTEIEVGDVRYEDFMKLPY